jgi:hypothetical protein
MIELTPQNLCERILIGHALIVTFRHQMKKANKFIGRRMSLNRFCAATVLGLVITMLPTRSYAQSNEWDRCMNVAKLAYAFAKERDSGVPLETFASRLADAHRAGKITDDDYTVALGISGLVFKDAKRLSPEQIRRQFASHSN